MDNNNEICTVMNIMLNCFPPASTQYPSPTLSILTQLAKFSPQNSLN